MRFASLPLLLLTCSLAAQGVEIYSNGPLVTNATGGFGGNPLSALQNVAPLTHTLLGAGAQWAAGNTLADDFAVPATGWVVDGIEVFGYLTAGTVPAATAVYLEIYSGAPNAGGVPIAGSPGINNNLFLTTGYTVTNTLTTTRRAAIGTPLDNNRIVQSIRVNFTTPIALAPGAYWLRFGYTGVNFTPPVTVTNQSNTGDAIQGTVSVATPTWAPVANGAVAAGNGIALPFKLYGLPSGLPSGSITNLGGGCSAPTMTVKGQPAIGGFLRAEMSGVAATSVGLVAVGLSQTLFPLACGCTLISTADIISTGNVFVFEALPLNPAFCGFELFLQGVALDGLQFAGLPPVEPCTDLGIALSLTDAWHWKTY